jgi:hypothetical protein
MEEKIDMEDKDGGTTTSGGWLARGESSDER